MTFTPSHWTVSGRLSVQGVVPKCCYEHAFEPSRYAGLSNNHFKKEKCQAAFEAYKACKKEEVCLPCTPCLDKHAMRESFGILHQPITALPVHAHVSRQSRQLYDMGMLSTCHSIEALRKTSRLKIESILQQIRTLILHSLLATRPYSAHYACDWCRWPPGLSAGKPRGLKEVSLGDN